MSRRPLRHWSRLGVACIALLVFSETLLLLASRAGGPVDVDIGPSTEDYLSGFAESEERPGVSFRWTHETASVSTFLLSSQGEGAVVLRYGRFLDGMARVRLFVDGQPAGSFEARPGRFRIQRLPVRFNGNPVRVELLTEDPAPERLGIAVDWIRFEGTRARLPLDFWPPRLLVAGLFLVCLLSGLRLSHAFTAAFILSAIQATWFAVDPFGVAHVSDKIASRAVLLGGVTIVLSRFISEAEDRRWLPLLFMVGYLLKGAAIFYPSFFSPDVLTHGRYVLAFPSEGVSLEARGVAAQEKSNIAYPRNVGGKRYAFPYTRRFSIYPSPDCANRAQVDEALKYAALAAAAAQTIVVYLAGYDLAGIWQWDTGCASSGFSSRHVQPPLPCDVTDHMGSPSRRADDHIGGAARPIALQPSWTPRVWRALSRFFPHLCLEPIYLGPVHFSFRGATATAGAAPRRRSCRHHCHRSALLVFHMDVSDRDSAHPRKLRSANPGGRGKRWLCGSLTPATHLLRRRILGSCRGRNDPRVSSART